ncbi:MAG: GHMP kinase [Planctomycetia bacterium]|nr:GHMP kinase [Planctomycetia bacterium]
MEIIRKTASARAGLMGNPSDGYHGKTISLTLPSFRAKITLYEWDQIEIVLSENDNTTFRTVDDLVKDVRQHGYYGGVRLIKATIKRFTEYCRNNGIPLHDRAFSVRYETTIPRQVGMAGSSAIIVATLRCLMEFYHVEIPLYLQPSLVLSVEQGELGITAGLQDRVIQVYEGLVFMDFSEEKMRTENGLSYGEYSRLEVDPADPPPLYYAFRVDASEPTEVVHNNLRARWQDGDRKVHAAMKKFAGLAEKAKTAITKKNWVKLGQLVDANFDLRRSICKIASDQLEMVEVARKAGVSAKFAGSGGAILGTFPDDATYQKLDDQLSKIGCRVCRVEW